MKILVKILNVLGAIFASLLLPVLIALLVATPIVSGVCSFTNVSTLTDMIKSIDLTEIAADSPDFSEMLEQAGVKPERIDKFLDAEVVVEFTEIYLEDISAVLSGERETSAITSETLLSLYDKHADEIVELIKEYSDEPIDTPDDEIKTTLRSVIEQDADKLLESLPKASDITEAIAEGGVDIDTLSDVFTFIRDTLVPLLICAVALLSLLMFGLRAYHLEGTIWLGVVYTICAFMLISTRVASDTLSSSLYTSFSELGGASIVIDSIVGALMKNVTVYAIVYLVIGLAMIGAFVAVRIYIAKKREAVLAENTIGGESVVGGESTVGGKSVVGGEGNGASTEL